MSLRTALAALFAALFLPLLLFGSVLLVEQWNQQRALAFERLTERAVSLRFAVEREVALDQAVLNTLASLPDFDRQDWAALHATARQATRSRAGSWIVVVNPDGQYVVNTFVPFGTALPNVRTMPSRPASVPWQGREIPFPPWRNFELPFQTATPFFTGLTYGPVVKGPVVAINAPVVRDGVTKYVMSMAYKPDNVARMLAAEAASDDLIRVVVDRDGLIIARSRDADRFVGRQASPPLDKDLNQRPPQGSGEGFTIDGKPVFYAYSRSAVNGWTVGVAVPRDLVLAPARQALWLWLAFLLTTCAIGVFSIAVLWRRLAIPLVALAREARQPERSALLGLSSEIVEVESLRVAMLDAEENALVRRRAEQDRERAERRFRVVVESSPSGILVVDAQGRITLVNQRVEESFGYSRDELLGQSIDVLVPPAQREGHAAQVRRFFSAPSTRAMGKGRDLGGRRKDGTEFPIEVKLVPIDTEEGQLALASIIDISDRKRAEDDLRRSNQDLEQFAYVASHDLQEPLRMVANYTEMLGQRYRGKLDDKADKYIHYAVDGAKRMQGLITDLLAFSRVGSRSHAQTAVAAGAAVSSALRALQAAIAESGAVVDVTELPTVRANEALLVQVFQNLIGNAIKFRRSERPHVVVAADRIDGYWRFSVKDNGIGFEPQFADRIFQMYQRLHDRGAFSGNGIGLSIVRRIVEGHGGRIWAESMPGLGSMFYFTLQHAAPAADESASDC